MKPIDPAEISALVDGELDAQRADEVRAAIAADAALAAEYERIRRLDGVWRAAASGAVFRPVVVTAQAAGWPWWVGAVVLGALVVLRVTPKMMDGMFAGVLVHVAVFVAVMVWIMWSISSVVHETACRTTET